MRRFKVTIVAIAALAILMATNAMAADPNVDSVLAIEYDNGVFAAAVLAHGPEQLVLARLLVNDVEIVPDRTDHIVLGPKRNLTLFKFAVFGPVAVIQPGDSVTAEVTDINNSTAEKTVGCVQGQIFHQLVVCR